MTKSSTGAATFEEMQSSEIAWRAAAATAVLSAMVAVLVSGDRDPAFSFLMAIVTMISLLNAVELYRHRR